MQISRSLRSWFLIAVALAQLASGSVDRSLAAEPAGGAGFSLRGTLRQVNPAEWWRTARTNYRDGRYYATDLTEHQSWRAALGRSVAPVDMSANVKAAFLAKFQPIRLIGGVIDPLQIELTRQIVGGNGIDLGGLARAMHPATVAATMAGGIAGDVAGAAVQSLLARAGPAGAAAGFFVRPMIGYASQILGYNVGQSVASGRSFRSALAQALRDLRPGRDAGQMIGGMLGSVFGQVLIPVPLVGGILGGMLGSGLGTLIGAALGNHGPTGWLDRKLRVALNRWADAIEGKKSAAPPPGAARIGDPVARGASEPMPDLRSRGAIGASTGGGRPIPVSPDPEEGLTTEDVRIAPR